MEDRKPEPLSKSTSNNTTGNRGRFDDKADAFAEIMPIVFMVIFASLIILGLGAGVVALIVMPISAILEALGKMSTVSIVGLVAVVMYTVGKLKELALEIEKMRLARGS